MQVKFNEINALPARTWRWMGVNGGEVVNTLPAVKRYTGKPFAGKVPANAEVYDIIADEINFMDDEKDPTLDAEVLKFVRRRHNSGFFVHIAPGGRIEEPLVFDYKIDKNNPAVVDDNLVVAEEGSEVTVVLHYAGDGAEAFHCGITKLIAKENATIRLIQVQTLGDGCGHFDNVGALAKSGAHIEVLQAELGGKQSYSNCVVQLEGAHGDLAVDTVYLGDGERKVDINVLAEHFGRRTKSEIQARGALLGHSEKIFRGTIDFKKGSSGSKGREEENTVLLSPAVRNRTAPLILCAEEDVDGHHAASTGRIDENRLFYLMSRGLTEVDAKKLIIEAEFAPIVEKIPLPAYRQEISDFLKERLNKIE